MIGLENNPFTALRRQLSVDNKHLSIATRLAGAVIAANRYDRLVKLVAVLDTGDKRQPYSSALESDVFASSLEWSYTYERLRIYAIDYVHHHSHTFS